MCCEHEYAFLRQVLIICLIITLWYVPQTVHQLDVPLAALPDIIEATAPTPVLRLSLSTGDTQPLVQSRPQGKDIGEKEGNGLMVLGGDVVEVFSDVIFTVTTSVTALPYWFVLRAPDYPHTSVGVSKSSTNTKSLTSSPTVYSRSPPLASVNSSAFPTDSQSPEVHVLSLSTREIDSPCNQCVLLLKEPLGVVEGDLGRLEVVWRDGVFNGTITSTNNSVPPAT
ncbi:hypothetical protein Pmani_031041 [Petrolisthes manimaculis]|uniref:Uncharacterized protein n=1 Tax=Petrolisthes manimaculis TaxID=1843537 RepID=A0AAE1NUF7_9EUCA|nr:hypothetical protein Pmani_031041 [Petrolisthes manimaculis]